MSSLFHRIRSTLGRLTGFARRDQMESRLDEEMQFHIDMATEQNIALGMSASDARRAALVHFGGREPWKEATRDEYRGRFLDELSQDLRYALRTLRGSPAFTITAVATLAIGIGANTAIFSAVDGVLLKPLPFSHQERIVSLFQNDRRKGIDRDDVAPGNFASWRESARAFSAMAAAEPFGLTLTTNEGQEGVGNWNVTEDFFSVLDAKPVLGRTFRPDDFRPNQELVIVLTYASWQRRFGGDDAIVGRKVILQGKPATIIGVLPRDFSYLAAEQRKYEMFAPKALDSSAVNHRSSAWYNAVARLKPNVTYAQATADINRVATQLATEYPRTNTGIGVTLVPLRDGIVGSTARALLLLLGAVGFVLLIACSNVANLMLARTAKRSREFAVRVALGAGPRRIARQVLTESFVIALLGGIVGIALAYWSVGAIRALSPETLPRVDEMHVDARALAFVMGVVVLTTFIFGVVPALRAADPATHDDLAELKAGARAAGSRGQHHLRVALVAAQVALAVVLLVGAGLLMRSFIAVTSADRGYQSDNVLTGTVFIWSTQRTWAARNEFTTRLVERASRIPGVLAAGATTSVPLAGAIGADHGTFTLEGQPVVPGEEPDAHITSLTPGAFSALRLVLLRGRVFTMQDDTSSAPVAVISQSFARRYFGNEDPVGRYIRLGFYGPTAARRLVGVVADVRQTAIDAPPDPTIYLPYAQASSGGVTIVLRTAGAPRALERELKRAVSELDASLPVSRVTTLESVVQDALRPRRFSLVLFGAFAAVALLLAVIGVYGVINHGTIERSREMGVRMALGAQPADIMVMVVRQGLSAVVVGVVIGLLGSIALTRLLQSMLFSVTPFDAATFAGVSVLILLTAFLACFIPARRATRVSPVTPLRAG